MEEAAILHNSKADKKFEKANKQKEMSEMKSYLTQGQSLKELAKKARADAETLMKTRKGLQEKKSKLQ